jgi:hypothetical protein
MHWQIAGSLGDCELKLGLYREAAQHLAYFLRESPAERHTAAAKKLYDEARAQVGAIVITVDVPGAEVTVDGKPLGKSPLGSPVFVPPGPYTVEARLGTKIVSAAVDAPIGVERTVALSLKASPPPAPPPTTSGPSVGWLIATGVVAAGGLAAGAGLTAAANGKGSEVAQFQSGMTSSCFTPSVSSASRCTSLHDATSSRATLSNAAEASFLVGGVFALATAGLGIWSAVLPKGGQVQAAPVVGASQIGLVVQGAW